MAQARDEAGNIWEIDAQGNPVRLVQAANAAQGQVFTLPRNPKEVANEAAQAAKDAADAADKATDNERADRKETREALEWAAKFNPDGTPRVSLTGQQRGAAQLKLKGIEAIASQVARVEAALEKAEKDGFVGPIYGNVPFSGSLDAESAVLDKSIAQLAPLIRQLTRTPGEGAMSDYESRLAAMALPARSDNPAALRESLAGIKELLTQTRAGYGEMLGGEPDGQQSEDELDKATAFADPSPPDLPPANQGGNDPTPWDGPNADMQTVASGGMRFVDNPRARSTIASLINAGAGYSTVAAAAEKAGGRKPSIQEYNAVKAWMKAHPGKEYPASAINASEAVPLNLGQKIAGSPTGAFAAQMANAATAGSVGGLAGEQGKGALDAMAAMHPNASIAGNIVGGITGAMGGEALLAARAPAVLAKFAPRAADAAYGGLYGFNASDVGEGSSGAVTGALTGVGGGLAGSLGARAAGATLRGVTNPAARYLRDRGVPLTVGQTVDQTGLVGNAIKGFEDRLAGLPLVGDIVNARRTEGLEAFNRAAFEDAGRPIGYAPNAAGKEGVDELYDAVGGAYDDATAGVQVPLDAQFANDFAGVAEQGATLPDDLRSRFALALNNRINPIADAGELTGETYQQAQRGLKSYKAENVKPGFEQDYRDALSAAQDALKGQMQRGGGDSVIEGLGRADTSYRNIKIIEDAIGRADGSGYVFTPSQLQDAAKKAGRKYPGERSLYDLADNAQGVLPSRVPDSGTAGRIATAVALGGVGGAGAGSLGGTEGAVTGGTAGLGATLLLALGGSKAGQNALTGALLNRPAIARAVGEAISRRSQLGGGFGAGVLTPLLIGN